MTKQPNHLAQLRFTGGVYDSCALDERALQEIVKMMRAITETAKELRRAQHPPDEPTPNGLNESHQVQMRAIQPCSAVVLLDHSPPNGEPGETPPAALAAAVSLIRDSVRAVCNGDAPPPDLTPQLAERYSRLGSKLESSAAMLFTPPDGVEARIDRAARRQFRALIPDTYEGIVDFIGRARASDVERRTFRVWTGPTTYRSADFSADDVRLIASALHDREETLLRVRGRGRYRLTGQLLHVDEVAEVDLLDLDLFERDPDAPSLSEMFERAFGDVPDEVWKSLPRDLTERHDDYFAEIGGSA